MTASFVDAATARLALGRVKRAMERYEQATRVQIAQSVFGAKISDRITVTQELLGSLGQVQLALEQCAAVNGVPLFDYMNHAREMHVPDPKLYYPDAVEAESTEH